MTDGILLNEMMSDFLLSKYGVIIIDEAHERKINSDLLLGLLSRVVNIRAKLSQQDLEKNCENRSKNDVWVKPLRFVIMSATLKVEDFTLNKYLFRQTLNVISVESRQFPVKIFHAKKTEDNYFKSCLKRSIQIHTKLPQGGILVFLTGEEEIKYFCKMLEIELQGLADQKSENRKIISERNEEDYEENDYDVESEEDIQASDDEDDGDEKIDDKILKSKIKLDKDLLSEDNKQKKSRRIAKNSEILDEEENDFVIYPLYSKLALEEQQKIFSHTKPNQR